MAGGCLNGGHIVSVHDGEDIVIALWHGHLDVFEVEPESGGVGKQGALLGVVVEGDVDPCYGILAFHTAQG